MCACTRARVSVCTCVGEDRPLKGRLSIDSNATKSTQTGTGIEEKAPDLTEALALSLLTYVTVGRLWMFSEP